MTPKLSIKNLHKSFGNKKVLQGVDFDINAGESLVILGGSGSGKSVLIKTIIGLLSADSGTILLDNQNLNNLFKNDYNNIMQKFGFLFQAGALFDSLKIWQNISFTQLNNLSMNEADAYQHAVVKLKQVGLAADVADMYPAELSGGMQKRASLARAISLDPEIILYDEPTTGLDPIMSNVINDLIVSISKEIGATSITITHDIKSAKTIADKAIMLYNGKIIWNGSMKNIEKTGNEYVDKFMDSDKTIS
jgi:phospholipid/cholesterol/gamma-HCH transport system ATP-binding protein